MLTQSKQTKCQIRKFLIITLGLFLLISCEQNTNDEPNVNFMAGSFIHQVSDNTFYKYANGQLSQLTVNILPDTTIIDTVSITSVNVPMLDDRDPTTKDTVFAAVSANLVAIAGQTVIFQFDGKSDGCVIFTGDSTNNTSHIYADHPAAIGTSVDRDEDHFGKYEYTYKSPGVYTAQMVVINYRDKESDPKEQVKSITITILDPADIPLLK